MPFYADFHLHSRYSRATSRSTNLLSLSLWARMKGLRVLGTGDCTHPAWIQEIEQTLVPEGNGLYTLRDDLQREVLQQVPESCRFPMSFILTGEISTIYKREGKVRKIHHVIGFPNIESVKRLNQKLETIGNIRSDGRPILGLDSRILLEWVLESGPGAFLIPAHIWTPWFSVLGARSGFDSIEDCYGDLSSEIFALETGLSSDPAMNARVASLDRFCLVSNSDAHSPQKLGREANIFSCEVSFHKMVQAMRTQQGFEGTVEFFPEEGKYHLAGHRACGVCWSPEETAKFKGICSECGKPVTEGVLNRVDVLSQRSDQEGRPVSPFMRLIPLPEVLSELLGVGVLSRRVLSAYEKCLERWGPELGILREIDIPQLLTEEFPALAEAIGNMRKGRVDCQAGHDGLFGKVSLIKESAKIPLSKRSTKRLLVSMAQGGSSALG